MVLSGTYNLITDQQPDKSLTLAQIFQKYFSIDLADTPELKQKAYNIGTDQSRFTHSL